MDETYYRIVDEKGHFADRFSFQIDDEDYFKGYYYSQDGYIWGSVLYTSITEDLVRLLDYLRRMSRGYGLHKKFKIVEIKKCDLGLGGRLLEKEFVI
jgi:hypothetical protein